MPDQLGVARVRSSTPPGALDAAVDRKAPERQDRRKLDGQQEAHLVALACSAPPEGRRRWTLRLLADRLVELELVESVSYETVRQALQQPPQAVAEAMPVHPARARCRVRLAHGGRAWVSTRPYDPRRPQVCLDETSRQLLAEVTPPVPVAPSRPARQDDEYQRRGVCNLFVVCEPLGGWRHVTVSARRTRIDWAHCGKDLLDVHYPTPSRSCWCKTTPNTHTPASLHAAFAPAEAKRLADQATLQREVAAWQAARNASGRGVDWRFTTEDARIKLKHLYPAIQD